MTLKSNLIEMSDKNEELNKIINSMKNQIKTFVNSKERNAKRKNEWTEIIAEWKQIGDTGSGIKQ